MLKSFGKHDYEVSKSNSAALGVVIRSDNSFVCNKY